MRAGWGEGVRPSRKNEQKGTFQPGMKTPNSTKSRAAQCILESYVALLMRMCIVEADSLFGIASLIVGMGKQGWLKLLSGL